MTIDSSGVFPENRKSCERFAPVVGCKQPTCKQKLQFRKKSTIDDSVEKGLSFRSKRAVRRRGASLDFIVFN